MAARSKKATKKTAKKARRGPPRFQPTDEQRACVSAMSMCNVPHAMIAKLIINPKTGKAISKSTLELRFKEEIGDDGKFMTSVAVGRLGRDMISDENRGTRAAIFWLKTREREIFSERVINENIDLTKTDSVERLTEEDQERVALSVMEQIAHDRENRDKEPSIHDAPAGSA